MAAAVNELETNGRPDVTWGIILLSDGVANEPIGGGYGLIGAPRQTRR